MTNSVEAEDVRAQQLAAMAEIGGMLAAAVLKAAAGKVSAAAADRVMLQWRFDDDLRDMMESIEAVIDDAERRSISEASVRVWLKRLTTASYSISDMFDEFEVNTSRNQVRKHLIHSITNSSDQYSLRCRIFFFKKKHSCMSNFGLSASR